MTMPLERAVSLPATKSRFPARNMRGRYDADSIRQQNLLSLK